jgi:hypothetical protein
MLVGFSQGAVGPSEKPASGGDVNEVAVPSFPYIAEITEDNVNIRSGPGTNYYRCGKLNKGDKVKVVGSQFSWSRIVPSTDSFSWISKQYVSIDRNDPTVGIVTGDNVRTYAGSELLKPIHSTTVQLKFNRGDKVKLLGEEEEGYYKIAPPEGAYLWLSTQYTKPLGPVVEVPPAAEPSKVEIKEPLSAPVVVPTNIPLESQKLEEYYALQKQIEAERAKPKQQQNYSELKKKLLDIAGVKETGKAARYSEYTVKQIERYELALRADKEIQNQDEQLQQIQKRIEKARETQLSQVPQLGRFAVIGQFQTSSIYVTEAEQIHYRIIDDTGKTACYVVASDSAIKMDLSKFVGKKVGVVGTIEPHPQTKGTLVRFTEIVELQ